MPSRAVVRGIVVLASCVAALIALVVALPFVASTQIVRNRIAQEVSDWSGYRVVLRGAPRIDVWPVFNATLTDVEFQEWGKPDAPPVLRAERIVIDLSAIAALSGQVSFTRLDLQRPVLRVARGDGALPLPTAPGGGRMTRAIDAARALVDRNPAQPDARAMPSDPLGSIEFSDGRIVIDESAGERELLSSLDGRANWPTLNRPGTLSAKGIWRGESVGLEASIDQPLALFAGGNARLAVALDSVPLKASFEGLSTLSADAFFDGVVQASSPSLRRLLEWSQTQIPPGAAVGAASIGGRVIGDMQRLKLEGAQISLGGHPGNGILEFALAGRIPGISGTLAFDTLDLRSFLSAFMRLPGDGVRWSDRMDTGFTEQIALDMRLSAARASAGPWTLSEVAATAQIKDGLAAFDISDATAFGGAIQAGFHVEHRGGVDRSELRLLADQVEMRALAEAAGLKRPLPQGRGTISVLLESPAGSWENLFAEADGSISMKLGPGQLSGLDLGAFMERSRASGFFPLAEIPTGTMAVEAAEIKSTVRDGVARLDVARAVTQRNTISLSGIIPYFGGGLALSGFVEPKAPPPEGQPGSGAVAFFVGGSWTAPFVSPILPPDPME